MPRPPDTRAVCENCNAEREFFEDSGTPGSTVPFGDVAGYRCKSCGVLRTRIRNSATGEVMIRKRHTPSNR